MKCQICGQYIGEDRRRKYCDNHREFRDGKWRRKNYKKEYMRAKKYKYKLRQTRITGSGFSEHAILDKKGRLIIEKEIKAIKKEKKRIGLEVEYE